MEALRKIIDASSKEITISLPEEYQNRKLELILLPYNDDQPVENKFDFSDLSGKMEWSGDAVAEQKKLRNEW